MTTILANQTRNRDVEPEDERAKTSGKQPTNARLYVPGNLEVQRMFAQGAIQAKLNVSDPGDFYEHEADRVAEEVMRAPGRAEPHTLQHRCGCEENPAQSYVCDSCRDDQLRIQRRSASSAGDSVRGGPAHEGDAKGRAGVKEAADVHEALLSAGRPLDAETRAFFEPRFGMDLGNVCVHSDAAVGASAKSLNALAYTVGRNIVFGQGQYDAGSRAGRQLLAHELAHVIQQDFGAGLSDAVLQRQADPQGEWVPGQQPETPADPIAPIPLPPEHEERVILLDAMAEEIETGEKARKELQGQVRNEPYGPSSPEQLAEREALKAQLTSKEETLVTMLEGRLALIDEALATLQQLTPGVTPSPPTAPAASGWPAPDASVQSEMYRLNQEKLKDASRLTHLKRCLAHKKIRQIEAQLADLPPQSSPETAELEEEKQKQRNYLKSSAADISCVKAPGQEHHPTEVSEAAFKKMKLGEGFVPTPYVALEGERTGVGGCTIGYGHVITEKGDGRKCKHAQGPEPATRKIEPGQKVDVPPHMIKIGNRLYTRCICTPDWALTKDQAVKLAKTDSGRAIDWVKTNVHVDLDQGQFDALVDITLAVGSIPQSLLDVIHAKLCKDDEAVRQEYMKTALYTQDNKELGPIHAKRRKERVWAPKEASKGDEDPDCI